MSNQTLIQIPLGLELQDPGRLRIFLLKLIEKLDIVLGYRGNDGYVSQSQLAQADNQINVNDLTLLSLAEQLAEVSNQVTENQEAIEVNTEALETVQAAAAITKLNFSTVTAGVTYNQTEVQKIANQAKAAGDKVDDLLDILNDAGIISL